MSFRYFGSFGSFRSFGSFESLNQKTHLRNITFRLLKSHFGGQNWGKTMLKFRIFLDYWRSFRSFGSFRSFESLDQKTH